MVILPRRVFCLLFLVVLGVVGWELTKQSHPVGAARPLVPERGGSSALPEARVLLAAAERGVSRTVPNAVAEEGVTAAAERPPVQVTVQVEPVHCGRVILREDETSAILANTVVEIGYGKGGLPFEPEDFVFVSGKTDREGVLEIPSRPREGATLSLHVHGFGKVFESRYQLMRSAEPLQEIRLRARADLQLQLDPASTFQATTFHLKVQVPRVKGAFGHGGLRYSRTLGVPGTGFFYLEDLPTGQDLKISLERDGHAPRFLHPSPKLEPGDARIITWPLVRGTCVRGVLRDQEGLPVVGSRVFFRPVAADADRRDWLGSNNRALGGFHSDPTDGQGGFSCSGVEPGEWRIGPEGIKHTTKGGANEIACTTQWVTILEQDDCIEVELQAYRGLFIRGRIHAAEPLPAFVLLHAYSKGMIRGGPIYSRPQVEVGMIEADFILGPLAPGPYELLVDANLCLALSGPRDSHSSSSSGPTDEWRRFADSQKVIAWAGDSGVDLRLRKGASVSLETKPALDDPETSLDIYPLSGMWLQDVNFGVTVVGKLTVEQLTPGEGVAVVSSPSGWCGVTPPFQIQEGQDLQLPQLKLERGAVLNLSPKLEGSSGWCEVHFRGAVLMRSFNVAQKIHPLTVPAGEVRVVWNQWQKQASEQFLHVAAEEEIEVKL